MEVGGVSLIFDRQNFPELLFPPQFSRSARAVNTPGFCIKSPFCISQNCGFTASSSSSLVLRAGRCPITLTHAFCFYLLSKHFQ